MKRKLSKDLKKYHKKRVKSIDNSFINSWVIKFDDGSKLKIEATLGPMGIPILERR